MLVGISDFTNFVLAVLNYFFKHFTELYWIYSSIKLEIRCIIIYVIVSDPIVKEQGRMVSSTSPTPNVLQGPINATE